MGGSRVPASRENFNPRPPCGGRRLDPEDVKKYNLFQSTPPVWGATSGDLTNWALKMISIHAPRVGGDITRAV